MKMKMSKKEILGMFVYIGTITLAFVGGMLMTMEINTGQSVETTHVHSGDTEIVYVDRDVVVPLITVVEVEKEVLVEVPVIEYVNVYAGEADPNIPLPIATHQYYLDWVERYEELIDDFIDELYRQWNDSYDLAYDFNGFLQAKLDNGESLDVDEVNFMLEFQRLDYSISEFYTWMDIYVEVEYDELMDTFPEDPNE